MKWTDFISEAVYIRLCQCETTREDLPILVNAKWQMFQKNGKAEQGFTKEDALVEILELLDCNSIEWVCDLTVDEYDELKR